MRIVSAKHWAKQYCHMEELPDGTWVLNISGKEEPYPSSTVEDYLKSGLWRVYQVCPRCGLQADSTSVEGGW